MTGAKACAAEAELVFVGVTSLRYALLFFNSITYAGMGNFYDCAVGRGHAGAIDYFII